MEAVRAVARNEPGELTMQTVAGHAGIGLATAYRHYPTVDDLLAAYSIAVVAEIGRFGAESALNGRRLFVACVERWVELLDEHGSALIQLRSRHGFLDRLRSGDEAIRAVQAAWRRPVHELLDDLDVPTVELDHALFLWNTIFDPREIDDLRTQTVLTSEEVVTQLISAYAGALRGWASLDVKGGPVIRP